MHCWYTGIWDEWWTEGMPCSCSLCPKSNIKREEAANHKTQTKNKQPNLTRSVPERWENCSKSWKKTKKHHHTHNLLSSLQVRVLFSWQSLTLHFWWSLCFSFVGWGHFLWQPGCDDHAAIISAFLGLRQAGLGHTHTHTQAVCADVRVSMTSVDIICLSLSSCGFTLTWTWTATCFILIFNYIPHGDLPFLPQRGRIPTPKWVLQACTLTCETFLTTSALTNSPWTNDLAVTNARITFAFMSRGTSPNGRSVSCCLATHSR